MILGGASIVLIPTIVIRAAGGSEAYLSWAVFSAVAISGVCTALQAVRAGRIGAGYVLAMGPAGVFIGLSAAALAQGGPALLGALVAASSLLPIVLSARLSLFRLPHGFRPTTASRASATTSRCCRRNSRAPRSFDRPLAGRGLLRGGDVGGFPGRRPDLPEVSGRDGVLHRIAADGLRHWTTRPQPVSVTGAETPLTGLF